MPGTVRRLAAFVEPGHRAAWLGLALLTLLVTGLEVVAALLIFVLTQHMADASAPLDVPVLGGFSGWFPGLGDRRTIIVAVGAIAGFFLIRAGVVLAQSHLRARVAEGTGLRISSRLFRGYLRMPYAFHLQRNSAELIRNVNDAVRDVVDYTLTPALRIISEVLVIVGLGIALVVVAPLAAALAAILLMPLVALMFGVVHPRIAGLGRTSHEMGGWALASLQQSLHGFRDITILGRREYFNEHYERVRKEIGRTRQLQQVLADVPRVALETGLVLFVALFIGAAVLAGSSTEESLAVLAMFAYTALRALPSLSRVVLQLNDLKFGAAAAAEVSRDLAAVESRSAATVSPPRDTGGARQAIRMTFHRSIRLERVSYRYPGSDDDSLSDISFEIRKGESIGIVGPTGAGKSTLLDIMVGLLPPARGRVLVDDAEIGSDIQAWQSNLGVVSQTVYLMDTTLRRNIALGFDDRDIDEDRIREAVGLAQLETFVASLPGGLDTILGERGIRISGGERQRVAIARALYRRPPVLILDEGTAALDTITEADLLRGLEALRRDRTVVVVAHRLTTVRNCDRILLVDAGRIVDAGPFHELLERNPVFRRLASAPPGPAVARDATWT